MPAFFATLVADDSNVILRRLGLVMVSIQKSGDSNGVECISHPSLESDSNVLI
jgi:hypothetical protein